MPVLRHLRLRKTRRKPRNRLATGTALLSVSAASTLGGALLLATAGAAVATTTVTTAPPALGHPAYTSVSKAAPVVTHRVTVSPFETVAPGDTLSKISVRRCGTAADWSGIFYANKSLLANPDSIEPGQVLRVSCTDPGYSPPAPPPAAHVQTVSAPAPSKPTVQPTVQKPSTNAPQVPTGGTLTADQVGALWLEAGGPAWAEPKAEEIAYCESGYRTDAYNPSGATGLWQILGSVVPGSLTDPLVNAENAVAKFKQAGDTFAAWVCQ